jgi:SAM-dependent methyltransferase
MTAVTVLSEERLNRALETVVGELGAAYTAPMVRLGDRLGLYRALTAQGPLTPHDLARRTGTHERLVREWLNQQTVSGFITRNAARGTYAILPEYAAMFGTPGHPAAVSGNFDVLAAIYADLDRLEEAFRSDGQIDWSDHSGCLFCGVERVFATGYETFLVQDWLPALDGVTDRLRKGGARVVDIGCGHGASTIFMAQAFPESRFTGIDFHTDSVEQARAHARERGVTANLAFETGDARTYKAAGLDLVTTFDALHDMGDPVGAARHIRETLAEDGTFMIVEPYGEDEIETAIGSPVARQMFAASTAICVPCSLSQEVGAALGAQAGPKRIEEVCRAAGFSRFRVAATTPFNLVLEARP